MKKSIFILFLVFCSFLSKGQFTKPAGAVTIPTYSFFRNPADSSITIYQGAIPLYNTFVQDFDTVKLSGWVNNRKLLKYRLIGDSILKDGTASNYKLLHKIDSIMALVKYRNDTIVITGYATRGYVISGLAAADTLNVHKAGTQTITGKKTFSNIAALTTSAESWIGPSSTAGIYFKNGNAGFGTIPGVKLEATNGTNFMKYNPTTATLSLSGVNQSFTAMPNMRYLYNGDADAALSFTLYNHDNMSITFDAYYNGTSWVSSDVGSNIALYKATDKFYFGMNSGIAKGSTFANFANKWSVDVSGNIIQSGNLTVSGTGNTSIAGNSGFQTILPTSKIHIAAGTATAGTAPLGFTSGALLTTPVAGKVEFLTDKWYGTITTGAARKTFAFLESPIFTGTVEVPLLKYTKAGYGAYKAMISDASGNIAYSRALGTAAYKDSADFIRNQTALNQIASLKITGKGLFGDSVRANMFVKIGGTSTQYLLADGSTTTTAGSVYKGELTASTGVPVAGGSALADGTGTAGWYDAAGIGLGGTHDYGSGNIALTDAQQLYYNGTIWMRLPAALAYTLPIATASDLGGTKSNGNVSVNASTGEMTVVTNANLTGEVTSSGNATTIAAQSSATWAGKVTDETGSDKLVFNTNSNLVTPILGTPQSGNFSTGAFTWPTFNQSTTGVAGSTTAAVTFAATGGGAAGTTFNGSTAQTIDYSTVGAQIAGSYTIINDSSKYYERIANKVTSVSVASTDIQYPTAKLFYDQLLQKRALNNHDSLSKLDERKYQSLTDTLTWGLALSQTGHVVKVDTTLVWTPTRASHLSSYPTLNQSTTGNAATSTILATTRAINGVNFNGSTAITVPSNITPGTSGNVMTSNGSVWTSATIPTLNQNTTGTAAKWTTKRKLFGRYIDGSVNMDSVIIDAYISSATIWNAKESALTFGLGLNRTTNAIKVDTTNVSILSRQRAANTYQVKGSYLVAADIAGKKNISDSTATTGYARRDRLSTDLFLKVNKNANITAATKTKISYDIKGLVTSGADATTADIAASTNKNYVTDAQQTVIGNTSGTNTGDNATNTQYSGLVTNATHTGDVTGATALTIGAGKVTLAMMANMATASLIYRKTAGAGAPEVNSLATLKTDLGLTGTNSGDQNAAGVSIADAGSIITGTNVETALQENRTAINLNTAKVTNATHSGDATGSTALTLATVNSNVGTYTKVTINAKGLTTAGATASTYDITPTANRRFITPADTIQLDNLTANLALKVAIADTSSMLGKYARKVSPTFTGTVVLPSTTTIGTITNTELGYVDGVTSAIQTQFTGKIALVDSIGGAAGHYATGKALQTHAALTTTAHDGIISSALVNTKILVGNVSGIATPVNISGDAAIANTGAVTVTNAAGNMRINGTLKVVGTIDDGSPDSIITVNAGTFRRSATSLFANASHNQAQSTIVALSDSLLARYTKTQANALLASKQPLATILTNIQDSLNIHKNKNDSINVRWGFTTLYQNSLKATSGHNHSTLYQPLRTILTLSDRSYKSADSTKLAGIATGATANTGTVTSVTGGTGITGGTITTTGTLAIDTTVVAKKTTVASMYQAKGNYQAALTNPVTGTGTTNYAAIWKSSSTLGSGVLYDNGTNVGIKAMNPLGTLVIGTKTGGEPTYRGDVIINQETSVEAGIGGLEFKSDASDAGYGSRILNVFDGGSAYDLAFQNRTNSATWTTGMTLKSNGVISTVSTGTSTDWNAAFGWGNWHTGGTMIGALSTNNYTTSADFGVNYTIGLATGVGDKGMNIGYNTALDIGFIGAVHNGVVWKTLALNPIGGNVTINGYSALYSGGALGTPSSGVATNLTGTATALNIGGNAATATNLTGLTTSVATLNAQSGTNTGDNSTNSQYSGLVTNATHSGDATGSTALTLATVNANVGTYQGITVNAKGLVTGATNQSYLTALHTIGVLTGQVWGYDSHPSTLANYGITETPWTGLGYVTGTPWTSTFTNTGTITAAYFIGGNFTLTASDSTLKRGIKPLNSNDLYKAERLQFKKYTLKSDPTFRQHYGLLAQDVKREFPEMVYTDPATGKEAVSYIEALIVKMAQMEQRIKDQDKRIEKLERKNRWKAQQMIIQ